MMMMMTMIMIYDYVNDDERVGRGREHYRSHTKFQPFIVNLTIGLDLYLLLAIEW